MIDNLLVMGVWAIYGGCLGLVKRRSKAAMATETVEESSKRGRGKLQARERKVAVP